MNQEESIALFEKCEAARKEALDSGKTEDEAHEVAKGIWNEWAEGLLKEKKDLEEQGLWEDNKDDWSKRALVNFSSLSFLSYNEKEQEKTQGEKKKDAKSIFFRGDTIRFENYIFPAYTSFWRSTFSSDTSFWGSTFNSDAYFRGSTFCGKTNFRGSTFKGDASFWKSTFNGNTSFWQSTFSRDATFLKSTFLGDAYFRESTLSGNTDFRESNFSGNSNFKGSTFNGNAIFWKSAFNGNLDFSESRFSSNANLGQSIFRGVANFSNNVFNKAASFNRSTFELEAYFGPSMFEGHANFKRSTFNREAYFRECTFKGNTNFRESLFEGAANFKGNTFYGVANFKDCTFNKATSFSDSIFKSQANFYAIQINVSFILLNAFFSKVPDFIEARFKDNEPPNLDNINVYSLPVWTLGYSSDSLLSAKFRKLKKMAILAHNNEGELEFHAQELRSNRFRAWNFKLLKKDWHLPIPLIWKASFWLSLAYGALSDFGRSITRPILAWLILVIVFSGIYLSQTPPINKVVNESKGNTSYISATWQAFKKDQKCEKPILFQPKNKTVIEELGKRHQTWKGFYEGMRKSMGLPIANYAPADKLLSHTNAPQEALYLSIKNGFVFIDWDRSEAALRTFGCLYGLQETKTSLVPTVPFWISVANIIQNILSAMLIFLFGLGLRNMLKLK